MNAEEVEKAVKNAIAAWLDDIAANYRAVSVELGNLAAGELWGRVSKDLASLAQFKRDVANLVQFNLNAVGLLETLAQQVRVREWRKT